MAVAAGTDLLCFGRDQDRTDVPAGQGGADGRGAVRAAAGFQAGGVGGAGRRPARLGRRPRAALTGRPGPSSEGTAARAERAARGTLGPRPSAWSRLAEHCGWTAPGSIGRPGPGRDRAAVQHRRRHGAVGAQPVGAPGSIQRITIQQPVDGPSRTRISRQSRGRRGTAAADRGARRAPVPGRQVRRPRAGRRQAGRRRGRDGTAGLAAPRTRHISLHLVQHARAAWRPQKLACSA